MTKHLLPEGLPAAHGLYDPRHEHDACGVGLIANIAQHQEPPIISDGLSILKNLEHRGAVGADPKAGDGAGVLLQIPHGFFAAEAKRLGFELPDAAALWRRPISSCRASPSIARTSSASGGKRRARKA